MTMNLGASPGTGGTNRQLRPTGHYSTIAPLAIGTSRQVASATQVIASIDLNINDGQTELVEVQLSADNGVGDPWQTIARAQHNFDVAGLLGVTGSSDIEQPVTFEVPSGWWYRFVSSGSGGSSITLLKERGL